MNIGINRVWYKSTGFEERLNVEVQFLYPNLSKSGVLGLVEFDGGLYYIDFDFIWVGNYAATFFEGGNKTTFKSFKIEDNGYPGIVTHG